MKRSFFCVLIALMALVFFSCAGKDEEILLDNSDPLALAPDVQWCVIIDPYVAFREDMSWSASVSGHCRKGDIFPIKGISVSTQDGKTETWYHFEDGWLPQSVLSVYGNKFKACNASALLK